MKRSISIILILSVIIAGSPLYANENGWEGSFAGELSSYINTWEGMDWRLTLDARYLPGWRLYGGANDTWSWDAEVSGNFNGHFVNDETDGVSTTSTAAIYRMWGRLYTDQLEVRMGRQEISFGPGKILRSVRWFDQKDSRDPTGFSEGVNALLVRYYYENNANVWLWSLAGNDDAMGNATLLTAKNAMEIGGRFQVPIGRAEIAAAIHQRQSDFRSFTSYSTVPQLQALAGNQLQEQKVGFDMNIDLGVGVYTELSYTRLASNTFYPETQTQYMLGADYTFDVGDGLAATFELFGMSQNLSNLDSTYQAIWSALGLTDKTVWMGALSLQYGLTLLDSAQLFVFHVPSYDFSMLQATWSRAYDTVTFNSSFFTGQCPGTLSNSTFSESLLPGAVCGTGVKFLIQYNH